MSKKFKRGSKVILTDDAYFWSNGNIISDWVRSLNYLYVMSSENGHSVVTCDESLIIQTGTISNDYLRRYPSLKKVKNNNDVNVYVYEGGGVPRPHFYTNVLIVKEGVKVIPENAFRQWRNLQVVILPESLSIIKYHAFYGCVSLKNVYIPDNVECIESDAFLFCENLI